MSEFRQDKVFIRSLTAILLPVLSVFLLAACEFLSEPYNNLSSAVEQDRDTNQPPPPPPITITLTFDLPTNYIGAFAGHLHIYSNAQVYMEVAQAHSILVISNGYAAPDPGGIIYQDLLGHPVPDLRIWPGDHVLVMLIDGPGPAPVRSGTNIFSTTTNMVLTVREADFN